ncbi:hypothetical protein KBB05_02345 [Patescibacteria group bacterium]|nr:hypothetical protein [Patescibacteria group bacterium]
MRIYHSNSLPIEDIVDDQSYNKLTLSCSSLPNNIGMFEPILIVNSYRNGDRSKI